MIRGILTFAMTAFLLAVPASNSAHASQAECDEPVDNMARIGWPGRLSLTIAEDNDEKECRFSIEGVPTGSPPEDQLMAAIQQVRQFVAFGGSSEFSQASQSPLLEAIPLLLAAASPRDSAEEELLSEAFHENIRACLELATSKYLPPPESPQVVFVAGKEIAPGLSEFGADCAVATPNALDDLNGYLGGSVRLTNVETAVLVVRNERDGNLTEYLILPVLQVR